MSLTTAPSSAEILQFEPNQSANRPEHNARALKSPRPARHGCCNGADDRLTHADQALVTQIYAHFNWTHFEKSGELLAWPSWETIAAEAKDYPSPALGLWISHPSKAARELHFLTFVTN